MGYKIDSVWTQMHEGDINELNKIIDNNYFLEREIAMKINIMKKLKDAFTDEISNLNWKAITTYMTEHNWKWYMGGEFDNMKIPTKDEMIKRLSCPDFLENGIYNIVEKGEDKFSVSSGGFSFYMSYIGGNAFVYISFDIAHFVND